MTSDHPQANSLPPGATEFSSDVTEIRPTARHRWRTARILICWMIGGAIGLCVVYFACGIYPLQGQDRISYGILVAAAAIILTLFLLLHILSLHDGPTVP